MPEGETTHLKLPYPTSAGELKNGATDIQELAETLDTVLYSGTKVANGQSYGLLSAGVGGTTYTPNAGRAVQVVLQFSVGEGETAKVKVNGTIITEPNTATHNESQKIIVSIIVPAGQTWEVVNPKSNYVGYNYLLL